MEYTSAYFLLFVAAVAALYFCFPLKHRWVVLLGASYAFYWIGSRWAIFYILGTTISTFYASRLLGAVDRRYQAEKEGIPREDRKARRASDTRKKKLFLTMALLLNFGILAVLKYGNFFTVNLNAVFKVLKIGAFPIKSFLLPLGVSFYTFQSMGYLIDVYRNKYEPSDNVFQFGLFVSFFPQVVQGPISRYDGVAKQMCAPNRFDFDRVKNGALLTGYGLVKKLVLADRLFPMIEKVFHNGEGPQYAGSIVLVAALLYSAQIYWDFSGGIDISRGVAQIFGIELAQNFERPNGSKSLAEFWRRWHMSLGAWMRDYLFYPILLSKGFQNLTRRIRNRYGVSWARSIPSSIASFIVFVIVGIWHGASWKYVAFGVFISTVISLDIILKPLYEKFTAFCKIRTDCFSYRLFAMARTYLLISLARCFSRSASLMVALRNFKQMILNFAPQKLFDGSILQLGLENKDYITLLVGAAMVTAISMLQERGHSVRKLVSQQNIWFRWGCYYLIFFALFFLGFGQNVQQPFIYFQF